jgi:hypothetical protein
MKKYILTLWAVIIIAFLIGIVIFRSFVPPNTNDKSLMDGDTLCHCILDEDN